MATESARSTQTASESDKSLIGFLEQVALVPGGVRISGWAFQRQSNRAPRVFIAILNDFSCEVVPNKVRNDVAEMNNVAPDFFGFDAVINIPMEGRRLTDLQIAVYWSDGSLMTLPMLEVARNGLSVSQRQLEILSNQDQNDPDEAVPIGDLTRREAEKYAKMYAHEMYRSSPGAVEPAARFAEKFGFRPGDVLIDFGSGPGYASNFFFEMGLRVIAIDIAPNALREEFRGKFPVIISAFWDLPAKLDGDWGMCADVMEHIPEGKVDTVLEVIRSSVRRSVLFNISLRHDGCGAFINDVLHLTVRPRAWWTSKLAEFWGTVEHVAGVEGDWSCWICGDRRERS